MTMMAGFEKIFCFPFDISSISGISGYWENNQPFEKYLWHPKQQTNLS